MISYPLWRVVEYDANDAEQLVEPFDCKIEGINIEEDYWIRIKGELNDGSELLGSGQINFKEGEIFSISLLVNEEWEVLHLPPAPDFVLEESGPIPFASKLKKEINRVFPMKIKSDVSKVTGKDIVKVLNI